MMRVLNLAVPILYKRLVDALAAASHADPSGASRAATLHTPPSLLHLLLGAARPPACRRRRPAAARRHTHTSHVP